METARMNEISTIAGEIVNRASHDVIVRLQYACGGGDVRAILGDRMVDEFPLEEREMLRCSLVMRAGIRLDEMAAAYRAASDADVMMSHATRGHRRVVVVE